MDRLLIFVIIAFFPLSIHAANKESIMFKDPEPKKQEAPQAAATDEHAKHCTALRKQINELKGKPQRRYAASERYKLECLSSEQ